MLDYDFYIIYRKGKQNFVVDALSRKDEDVEALLCAISIIQHDLDNWSKGWIEEWWRDVDSHWKIAKRSQFIWYI